MIRTVGSRAFRLLLLGATLAWAAAGCSRAPVGVAPAEPVPTAPEESAATVADSTRPGAPADTATVAAVAPDSVATDSGEEKPAEPAPAAKETPPEPDPDAIDQVKVQLSDAERVELEDQARASLREARRVIRSIDRTTLSPERLEKLNTAESLLDAAKAAFDDDVRAAASLAHKASVLLAELTTD